MKCTRREALLGAGAAAVLTAPAPAVAIPLFNPTAVVEAAASQVREQYVDPVLAAKMADALLRNLAVGQYRTSSQTELASRLTSALRGLSNDLHFAVNYEPASPEGAVADALPEDALHPRTTNYGVQTVARLQGNIGFLRVTHFPSPPFRFDNRYGAAMELLRDTNGLIVDLRDNHGGGTDTTGFFLSYFLNGDIEFGRIHWRHEADEVVKTTREITGPAYGEDRPMSVLISSNTFSAGEAVAYHLKQHKRATLIGEQTKGGAHPGNFIKLPQDFTIFVPMGRGEGPDWEGVGVAPDVRVPPTDALKVAHRLALQRLLDTTTNDQQREILRNILANRIENLSSFND